MKKMDMAVAYGVKRKAKKMAKGGMANESAASEARPMPEERDKDAAMVSRNSEKHALPASAPDYQAPPRPKTQPIKHPRHIPISGASLRLRDQEDDQMLTMKPNNGPQEQPSKAYDEEGADRKGPDVPALHMKKMAEGGEVEKRREPLPMEEHDEIDHMHSLDHDMMEVPEDEAEEEHHSSIAAAIMAKRRKMADGGILSHDSIYTSESEESDLSRNADEDANEEDQLSFNALRKENYSESDALADADHPRDSNLHGDPREDEESDKHDRISRIRAKMAIKRSRD